MSGIDNPSAAAEYEADFTPAGNVAPVICTRPDCAKEFPPGTQLQFLHSRDPSQPGRALCNKCYVYYRSKETTRRRAVPNTATGSTSVSVQEQRDIHKDVARAQRGGKTNLVQAVGLNAYRPSESFQRGYIVGTSNGPLQMADSPSVWLPGNAPQLHRARPILQPTSTQVTPGYTKSHADYNVIKKRLASQAYSKHSAEVVTCEARLTRKANGGVKSIQVGDVLDALDNIPVHIGAVELKFMLFNLLLPMWIKWSKGFELGIDDVIMRSKDWVKITPRDPDVDAISSMFFKTNNKNGHKVFKAGRCIILFHLPEDVYKHYEKSLEVDSEEENEGHLTKAQTRFSSSPEKKKAQSRGQRKRNRSPDSVPTTICHRTPKHFKADVMSTVLSDQEDTNIRPRALNAHDLSPTANRLGDVLRLQRPPTDADVQSLFSTLEAIYVAVRPLEHRTMSQFIELVSSCSDKPETINYQSYLGEPQHVTIYLDLSSKKQHRGGFKVSSLGTSSQPVFGADRGKAICAKQTYYKKTGTVTRASGETVQITQNIPHDGRTQARGLTIEIACLAWARVLLDLVYGYIQKDVSTRGPPPFHIPQFRFVEAGLAVEHTTAEKETRVFLLEEVIGRVEGPFRKYLNNVSPVPLSLASSEDQDRGLFLAFSQHVQYYKTKKMVFVSDYQGGSSLLTDPQIVTDKSLGIIFADGNVPASHDNFEKHHRCNKFCVYFQVPVDYDLWESRSSFTS